jgi:ketose-bisphosphate aldolase
MALVKVNELLKHATSNRYGIAAINVFQYESVKWAIQAAEIERTPIIIQLYPGFGKHISCNYVSYIAKDMAQKAFVPVGIHLDHSHSFEIAVTGIRDGFPSVMVDSSALPFEDNVQVTSDVVRVARIFGVDVEAELGHVGSGSKLEDIVDSSRYTSVEQAVDFVAKTGCDSLAVAVGNAHGVYIKEPKLDMERIKALRKAVGIPLVLHGCSDIPGDQLEESVNLGMSKFNIATEYDRAMYQSFRNKIDIDEKNGSFFKLISQSEESIIDFVRGKIRLLNPNHYTV